MADLITRKRMARLEAKRKRQREAAQKTKQLVTKVAAKQKQIKKKSRVSSVSTRPVTRGRAQTIRYLQGQAAKMRIKAKEVDESGTGNVKAAATYRRTAKLYLKRVAALQAKSK